ncbi:MAG: hypothetical protein JXA54_02435 [Candidatus Heimdallarchaeota archaeon]|nr:hypothetical protein [Candidatus Heimdallarchaeota archaeon]
MKKKRTDKLTSLKTEFERNGKEKYVTVFDGSELRTLTFDNPTKPKEEVEIMFIPGLLTVFPRWEKVVKELNEYYAVHYIESREKRSSKIGRKATMKIEEMRKDLVDIEKSLGLDKKKYITISSSMGGSLIIENLAAKALTPIGSILISPGVEIIFPKAIVNLLRILPAFAITMFKPYIKWHLKHKAVDAEKEPEQLKQYTRSITEADFKKMKKVIIKNANRYNGWEHLPKLKDRILLIGASTDKTHSSEFSRKVSNALGNCTFVDLGTNKAAHDTPLVKLTEEFIKELTNKGPKITERIFTYEEAKKLFEEEEKN